jgi:hypothetical protein
VDCGCAIRPSETLQVAEGSAQGGLRTVTYILSAFLTSVWTQSEGIGVGYRIIAIELIEIDAAGHAERVQRPVRWS